MLGWTGATVLTKVIYWILILYIVTFIMIADAYKDLPREQWAYNVWAAVFGVAGLSLYMLAIEVLYSYCAAQGTLGHSCGFAHGHPKESLRSLNLQPQAWPLRMRPLSNISRGQQIAVQPTCMCTGMY